MIISQQTPQAKKVTHVYLELAFLSFPLKNVPLGEARVV